MTVSVRLRPFDAPSEWDRRERSALAEAEARGYERGLADARAEAAEIEAAELSATEAAVQAVGEASRTFSEARDLMFEAGARFAAEAIRAAFPVLAERGLAAEMAAIVGAAARAQQAKIIVEVSSDVAERLGESLSAVADVTIVESEDLTGASARAYWGDGGCAIDLPAVDAALERIIASSGIGSP